VAIEFSCPRCGKFLTTSDSRALALAKCPSCNDIITVPAQSEPDRREPAEAASVGSSVKSPEFAATAAWSSTPTPGPSPVPTAEASQGVSFYPVPIGPAIPMPHPTSNSTAPPPASMQPGAATSESGTTAAKPLAPVSSPSARPRLFCPRCGQPAEYGAAYCAACGLPFEPPAYPLRYPGFFRRVGAALIDLAIISLAFLPLELLFHRVGGEAAFLIWFFYYTALESSRDSATIGKRALGMAVCGVDGRRLTFPRAAIRTLAKLVSAAICGMGFIMPLLTPKKQALHDLITDSVVVLTER
jgi:uncharacterized RDD family membrane protein YckC